MLTKTTPLIRKLHQLFINERDRREALRELQRYGVSAEEPEDELVRLAILKLAGGSLDELRKTVDGAKEDWEDIVDWAKRPRQTRCRLTNRKLHDSERQRIEREDGEEWTQWMM